MASFFHRCWTANIERIKKKSHLGFYGADSPQPSPPETVPPGIRCLGSVRREATPQWEEPQVLQVLSGEPFKLIVWIPPSSCRLLRWCYTTCLNISSPPNGLLSGAQSTRKNWGALGSLQTTWMLFNFRPHSEEMLVLLTRGSQRTQI